MLARQNFGRRHHRRLPSPLDDIAPSRSARRWSCPSRRRPAAAGSSASGAARSARISSIARRCAPVSANGSAPRGVWRSRPRRACARPANGAHPRAHQQQRELVGEQFVIGEPARGRAGRLDVAGRARLVHRSERLGEARRLSRRSVSSSIHSGRCGSRASAPAPLCDGARIEPLGQAVDRLDRAASWRAPRRPSPGRDGPSAAGRPTSRACRRSSASRRPAAFLPSIRDWRGRRRARRRRCRPRPTP